MVNNHCRYLNIEISYNYSFAGKIAISKSAQLPIELEIFDFLTFFFGQHIFVSSVDLL